MPRGRLYFSGGHFNPFIGHQFHPFIGGPFHPWYRRYRRRWPWFAQGMSIGSGAPSPTVAWAQGCLAQLFGTGVPQDGILGPDTRQAIQQFQSQHQLPATGMLDENTVGALQAACSGQQQGQDGQPGGAPTTQLRHHVRRPPGDDQPLEKEGGFPFGDMEGDLDTQSPPFPPASSTGMRRARRTQRDAYGNGRGVASGSKPSTLVIWFEYNSTKLRQDAEADSVVHLAIVIKAALEHLKGAGVAGKVILHGYSSREGGEEHNRDLALQRAQRVKELLIDGGVPEASIQVIGHGASSEWPTLKWNRRVEVEFQP